MKVWLLFILASMCLGFSPFRRPFQTLSANSTCPQYMCHPATMNFSAGTCVYPVNNTNYLQPCNYLGARTSCVLNTTTLNSTCVVPTPQNATSLNSYPGEVCNTTSDCVYGSCLNRKCKGVGNQGQCVTHLECDPNLRCFNSTCQGLLPIGFTDCSSDYDCVPNSGCNITSETGFGVCVPYLSIPNGAPTGSDCQANPDFAIMCASGWCQKSSWLSKSGTCIQAPSSPVGTPNKCIQDSDCIGSSPTVTYLGKCTCGFNPTGTSYCELFPGDSQGTSLLAKIGALANSGVLSYCNTARRFAPGCWNTFSSSFIADLESAIYYYNYYPLLQGNDNCIKILYLNAYYQIPPITNLAVDLLLTIVSTLVLA